MSPIYFASILGVAMAVLAVGEIAPSVATFAAARSVEASAAREAALFQQIVRYKAAVGSYPADVAAMVSSGYWRDADNDNGFGGNYSFSVDAVNDLITIETTISDGGERGRYLAAQRRGFKPAHIGNGVLRTTFVIPGAKMPAGLLPPVTSIPAQSVAPDPATNTWWYDTSGTVALLKVSNGLTWTSVGNAPGGSTSGSLAPSATNIVTSTAQLPSSAKDGDVRYVYDEAERTVSTVVYYDGSWTRMGSGSNATLVTALNAVTLPLGHAEENFSFDLSPALSARFSNTFGAVAINPSDIQWSVVGLLPTGLSLSPAGVLSGIPASKTPIAPGGTPITVSATYKGNTTSNQYTLLVSPPRLRINTMVGNRDTACAITTSGATKCWVRPALPGSDFGGLPSPASRFAIYPSTYDSFSCAVLTSGAIYCWGKGSYGRFGNGDAAPNTSSTPIRAGNGEGNFIDLALNYFSACGLQSTGAVRCWGTKTYLGVNATDGTAATTPVSPIGLTSGAIAITGWGAGYCALTNTRTVQCWGSSNTTGVIGNGTTSGGLTPSTVSGLSNVLAIQGSSQTMCALISGGQVRCWGSGVQGALGDGTNSLGSTPRPAVNLGEPAVALAPAATDVSNPTVPTDFGAQSPQAPICAKLQSGKFKCWGAYVGMVPAELPTLPDGKKIVDVYTSAHGMYMKAEDSAVWYAPSTPEFGAPANINRVYLTQW